VPFIPFKPVTHLKAFDLRRPWEDRTPALCGTADKGTFFFLAVESQGELDRLIAENKGKPYPLCLQCGIQQERAFEAR
jgi:hypothetical protein